MGTPPYAIYCLEANCFILFGLEKTKQKNLFYSHHKHDKYDTYYLLNITLAQDGTKR